MVNQKYSNIRVEFSFKMISESGADLLNDSDLKLLQEINSCNSIRKAAEVCGISYRKAWGDLCQLENMLEISLVEKNRGGKFGGKTVLTSDGERLVSAYSKLVAGIHCSMQNVIKEFKRTIKEKSIKNE